MPAKKVDNIQKIGLALIGLMLLVQIAALLILHGLSEEAKNSNRLLRKTLEDSKLPFIDLQGFGCRKVGDFVQIGCIVANGGENPVIEKDEYMSVDSPSIPKNEEDYNKYSDEKHGWVGPHSDYTWTEEWTFSPVSPDIIYGEI